MRTLGFLAMVGCLAVGCTSQSSTFLEVRSSEIQISPNPPEIPGSYYVAVNIKLADDEIQWGGGVDEDRLRIVTIYTAKRVYDLELLASMEDPKTDNQAVLLRIRAEGKCAVEWVTGFDFKR